MLSRVAERVYWLARYLERTENTARLAKANFMLQLDLPKEWAIGWDAPLQVSSSKELYKKRYKKIQEKQVIKFILSDLNNPSSLISSIHNSRESVRTTREILPSETWEIINELYAYSQEQVTAAIIRDGRYEYLDHVIAQCQQLTGLFAGIMTKGLAYQFIRMGRNLERADMTTRVIDIGANTLMNSTHQSSPYVNLLWVTLLRSLNGFQMFRQSRGRKAEADSIIDFLILNKSFPRAVSHCLDEVKSCSESIKRHKNVLQSVKKVIKRTDKFEIDSLDYKKLHKFLDKCQLDINTIHNSIADSWFVIR